MTYLIFRDMAGRRGYHDDLEENTEREQVREKRTTYGFGLGKRAEQKFDHEAEKRKPHLFGRGKWGQWRYTYGLGKRSSYGSNLGK